MYLLGLLHGVGHGEEDAVEQDGRHDHVVEVRVRRQVDGDPAQGVPRREEEARTGRGEPVDVVLAESVRHDDERLGKHTKGNNQTLSTI